MNCFDLNVLVITKLQRIPWKAKILLNFLARLFILNFLQ